LARSHFRPESSSEAIVSQPGKSIREARPNTGTAPRWRRILAATSSAGYFVAAFTTFLLVLIWGVVIYQIDHDRTAVIETAQVNTHNLARAYAERVRGALQLLDQGLLRIKGEYEGGSTDVDVLPRLMDNAKIDALTAPVGLTDANGHILASNLGRPSQAKLPPTASPAANSAADRDYFQVQMNRNSGNVYVSAPLTSRITGKTAIALSRRLNKPDGSFGGVVFASFDPDYLSGFFSDLTVGKHSSFAIIGTDMVIRDMIRGSGRATDLIGKSIPNAQLFPALAKAATGDYEAISPLDGVARFYSYRSLADYGLIVLATAATPDILIGFSQREAWMLWTAAALSLLFIVVAAYQLQRIAEGTRYRIALNRSNERLSRAQHLAAIGCFEHDVLTGKAEWSDAMYRILGIENTTAVPGPETLLPLIHPDDHEKFKETRDGELAGRSGPPLEYRIVRPDGAERIVRRENAIEFDSDKRPVRRYGTLQDITELRLAEYRERELERQLLHSQKLEALGTLAGGIAHDLNNTLTPIMALSKLSARRLEAGSNIKANLETIFAASQQARDLVRRVLAFSRRDEAEKILTSPREVVGDALKLLRATLPSSIYLDAQLGEVPPMLADPSQIHQVITNLMTNAAHAIETNPGRITVILERPPATQHSERIRLSVIDTGKGMDEGTRRRIFEPFFTTKEVGQGTGLGLSIIEGIVNDHGGRIEVESEPGKGTRFDIYFPAAAATSAAA
jgi:PAS domain S-box-containing protein